MFSRIDAALSLILSPWQSIVLALLGFSVGLLLHLRWHPLRQHLSDAWDFLRQRSVLVVATAGSILLASAFGEKPAAALTVVQLGDWREIIGPLAREAAAHVAQLPHMLIQPWPLACLMPVVLVVLTIRIWRWPYRYGERRPVPEQKAALLAGSVIGCIWLALEVATLKRMLPEAVEMLRLGTRYIFTALAAAGTQVWLVRFLLAWERPQDTEAERDATVALEQTFARWQGVACLAAFDLVWICLRQWLLNTPHSVAGWVWIELLLVFCALPVAVGTAAGSFFQQGAVALRILGRAVFPLLQLAVTAVAIFILASYASAMAQAGCADAPLLRLLVKPVNALVLAMPDSWLLLTALLLMLRHGFPRSPSA